jgi:polyisoprenoid-binding protein YceI
VLLVGTGVMGRAAKMGHRLTIAMNSWRATVRWSGSEPTAVELTIEVVSLQVLRGEGGVTPLSGPEKVLVRSNALKSLDAERFPQIRFQADDIEKTTDGYRLTGKLEIHGKARERVIDVRVEDLGNSWRISGQADVRQSDFGVKPYSLLMGSMKVVDNVTVSFTADRAKDD